MTTKISPSKIYQTLRSIIHPELQGHNLVELNMIHNVTIDNSNIAIDLALPSLDAPIKQNLIDEIHRKVSEVEEGLHVQVNVVEMNPSQKEAFQSTAREALKAAPKPGVQVRKVLAVMSGKGGVGKSSVAGLLASSLRKRGLKIGLLDADITGPSIPKMFGAHQSPSRGPNGITPVESRGGIKIMSINLLLPDENQPVIWRGPLVSRAIQQFWSDIAWGRLDALIVDLPPGTSDASLTVMQSLPLDGIVLVTSPQDLAGMVVRKAANMANNLGVRLLGLVENMSYIRCPECGAQINLFGVSNAKNTAASMGTSPLGHIPLDPKFSILCDKGEIEAYHSETFEQITERLIERAQLTK
jgi:Mrp family chromosome partitioning ATPase